LITHWFLNKDRVEQKVLDTSIAFDEYAKKDFVTPSFELKGSSAPLTIQLHSNVDNSWANVQVALINEKMATKFTLTRISNTIMAIPMEKIGRKAILLKNLIFVESLLVNTIWQLPQ